MLQCVMAGNNKRSKSETVRLWIEAVGIPVVIAALGLWQFWLKEVRWPSEVPVNLTAELSVKDAGFKRANLREEQSSDQKLEAIELEVTARNPSTRPIYLLDNLWIAYGIKITPTHGKDWLGAMETQINGNHQIIGGSHYEAQHPIPVAAGNVFTDNGLQPNEKIVRTFVFYVPQGEYDYVEVDVGLPTVSRENPDRSGEGAARVEYKLREDRSSFLPTVFLIGADGNPDVKPTADEIKDLGFQWAVATRMLSLWPASSPSPSDEAP